MTNAKQENKKMNKLVVYVGVQEIIVTTQKAEVETVRQYFTEGGRDLDDYDREEPRDQAVCISSQVTNR
jgi:hypothetical protein